MSPRASSNEASDNPLYLRELLLGGIDTGLLCTDSDIWRLSHKLRTSPRLTDLVAARLADLSHKISMSYN